MAKGLHKTVSALLAIALAMPSAPVLVSQEGAASQPSQQADYVFKANAELVLTNVVVRDAKTGELVRGLKQSDFSISENGKRQQISTFDFQSVEMATPLNEATVSGLAASVNGPGAKAAVVARPEDLRNHRLIVMFFDLTSMGPEDLDRCVKAARDFLTNKMQPADLVALVSLGDTLKVDQDFTADKAVLANEVGVYNGTEGEGFAQGATANSNQAEDATGYTPDESEYNDLNTDRELFALRAIAKSLEKISVKKSLLYFSGGISRDGIENQASLRAAVNAAVRANLSIYSVDTRGL
jgi:VWFA-related protein